MRILSLSFFLLACDDHKFTGGHGSSEPVEGDGYEAVKAIFDSNCAGCHGATPPAKRHGLKKAS